MKYGLSDKQLGEIVDFIAQYPEVESAVLFGSRALGTYKEASDVDIALHGDKVNHALAAKMKFNIEEDTYLPFLFDFVAYPTITNDELKKHINTKGLVVFQRKWVDWKETTTAKLILDGVLKIGDGYRAKNSELVESGIPFARAGNINGGFHFSGADCLPDNYIGIVGEKSSEPGDTVFTSKGTVGRFAFVTNKINKFIYSPQLCFWRSLNHNYIYPRFLYFWMNSREFLEQVERVKGQTDMADYVNLADQRTMKITLPPHSEQKAIASVLASLDDKIDLLHRQNKTFEAMAETLFRQWFVEEAEGDWEERPLSSIADFLNGLACQKFPPQNEIDKLPVLKIKELSNGICEASDWATSKVKPQYIVETGDVIFSWSASLMVKVWDGEKCVLNQHLFKVTSDEFPKWFYLMWCKHHLAEFISISSSHATTMGHIKRGDLDTAKVLVPSPDVLIEMTSVMGPLLDKEIENSKQLKGLEKLRDTLLPKLMSGEVRVAV